MDFLWTKETSKNLGDFAPSLYCPATTTTKFPQRANELFRDLKVQISKDNKFRTPSKQYFDRILGI